MLRTWRTEIHFLSYAVDGRFLIETPVEFGEQATTWIYAAEMSDYIVSVARPGYRCHAAVNLDAADAGVLMFTQWERD